jgi:alcohol dehydrogenase YqhD (iron-dependent ADH family)
MENFIAHVPTELHFGKGVVDGLGSTALKYGKRALLVYGKGSVLKNGSHKDTKEQLEKNGIEVFEYSGIKPNPVVDDVDAAVKVGQENGVDMVIAIGGGSAIDSAKLISVAIVENCGGWEIMKGERNPIISLPLIAVLTLAATATEMNSVAVIQNHQTMEKIGYRHHTMYPRHSFLDPTYTLSVPRDQTVNGIVDLIAHVLEQYFGQGDASLSDRFSHAIIQEAMEYGPQLLDNPDSYLLRARIMWAATNALNGLTSYGRLNMDGGVHSIGHILSLLYDTAHGATLSIAYPAWMRHLKPRIRERLEKLGENLFNDSSAGNTIEMLEDFFRKLGSPVRLQDVGLGENKRNELVDRLNRNQCNGRNPDNSLNDSDREAIVDLMLAPLKKKARSKSRLSP